VRVVASVKTSLDFARGFGLRCSPQLFRRLNSVSEHPIVSNMQRRTESLSSGGPKLEPQPAAAVSSSASPSARPVSAASRHGIVRTPKHASAATTAVAAADMPTPLSSAALQQPSPAAVVSRRPLSGKGYRPDVLEKSSNLEGSFARNRSGSAAGVAPSPLAIVSPQRRASLTYVRPTSPQKQNIATPPRVVETRVESPLSLRSSSPGTPSRAAVAAAAQAENAKKSPVIPFWAKYPIGVPRALKSIAGNELTPPLRRPMSAKLQPGLGNSGGAAQQQQQQLQQPSVGANTHDNEEDEEL
jgi:hypothetical protein